MEGIPAIVNDWATKDLSPWDGKADPSFRLGWFRLLKVMLGNIYQDRDTLLRCAMGQDVGFQDAVGPGGVNPSQVEVDQHRMRKRRLGAVILQKMTPNTYCHILFTSDPSFMNDGVAMYNFLFVQGHRAHSQHEVTELQNSWQSATMSNVGIKLDENGLNNWRNWIERMGEILHKGNMQKRRKFYDGLPESFESVVGFESSRPDAGSFLLDANYPAHHPLAGQVNPQGGQPDLSAIVAAFTPSWVNKVKARKIQAVPKGMANLIDVDTTETVFQAVAGHPHSWWEDTSTSHEQSNSDQLFSTESCDVFQVGMQPEDDWPEDCQVQASSNGDGATDTGMAYVLRAEDKDKYMKSPCFTCGGFGHHSSVDGQKCLTAQLGIQVDRSFLQKVTYPDGMSNPFARAVSGRFKGKGKGKGGSFRGGKGKSPFKRLPPASARRAEAELAEEHDGEEYDERAAHNIKSIAVDFESMFYSPVGGAGCSYLPQ